PDQDLIPVPRPLPGARRIPEDIAAEPEVPDDPDIAAQAGHRRRDALGGLLEAREPALLALAAGARAGAGIDQDRADPEGIRRDRRPELVQGGGHFYIDPVEIGVPGQDLGR